MDTMKRAFSEIDFEDTKFVPNLKRIPQDVQDNIFTYLQDASARYNEWYKMEKRLSKSTRRPRIELANSQQMVAQNEQLITGLRDDLEEEKRAKAEDALRAKSNKRQKNQNSFQ